MSRARDLSKFPSVLSQTELGYLDGITSAIQTQLDAGVTLSSYYYQSYQMTGGNYVSVGIYTGSTDATERRTLNIPPMLVNIDGTTYRSASAVTKDLNTSGNWDSATYATAANRVGKDFYLYACVPSSGSAPTFVLSANATYPTGYTANNSRKIGGFHCLGVSVGTISGHDLTGYIAGDILPRSVWDLDHRSASVNEGFVYGKNNKWVAIYLPSVSGGELVSVYGGTIADGTSATVFHSYKFEQWFGRIGQSCIDQSSFIAASIGANQSTNISGSSDPGTTGGHTDTAGRRMISNIGCEDMCGVLWQWGFEHGGPYSSAATEGPPCLNTREYNKSTTCLTRSLVKLNLLPISSKVIGRSPVPPKRSSIISRSRSEMSPTALSASLTKKSNPSPFTFE